MTVQPDQWRTYSAASGRLSVISMARRCRRRIDDIETGPLLGGHVERCGDISASHTIRKLHQLGGRNGWIQAELLDA